MLTWSKNPPLEKHVFIVLSDYISSPYPLTWAYLCIGYFSRTFMHLFHLHCRSNPAKCNPSAYKGQITASKSETKEGNTFSQGGVLLVCHKDRPVIPNSHALRAHAEVEVSCCSGANVFQPIQDTGGWFGCLCTNPASAIGGLGEGRRLPCYVFSCPEQLN